MTSMGHLPICSPLCTRRLCPLQRQQIWNRAVLSAKERFSYFDMQEKGENLFLWWPRNAVSGEKFQKTHPVSIKGHLLNRHHCSKRSGLSCNHRDREGQKTGGCRTDCWAQGRCHTRALRLPFLLFVKLWCTRREHLCIGVSKVFLENVFILVGDIWTCCFL